ncbi:hypothetical protein [Marinobacterium litorale]|uniref:hypothetical protein n=1 Tax=Marinobacterium litorale TaxID=404770 RepID=UPI000429249C|nr:hypothetical protein [Marinobacterium litorale]
MDYQALIDTHFGYAQRRSPAYQAGLKAWLQRAHEGIPVATYSGAYREGTAEFDAFYAGADDACMKWRDVLPNEQLADLKPIRGGS